MRTDCHTTQKTTTIWDAVEAEADVGQVVEQVAAGAIEEAAEAVAATRLAAVAPPAEILELRGAATSRPMVMPTTMHCS
jgi:hypothetical protein